ncbi:type VI secretion system protein ImpH [Comamonas sp. BIGb0152]|uniref:type VI secretion system baseplate subunit TssG n=1 Tax=Comamonas sp. BIGb0152 TaxID=2940601 RepID=UPI00216A59B7|nr:type VI secretion system baseplate subunit TssG [Comamonas sp. BIGb0152]MCS4292971.1 type VI secretion system protein ImpH [Comamonas sp. BIGb0152]
MEIHNNEATADSAKNTLASWLDNQALPVESIDLFALLRHIDARSPGARLGYSRTPREDAVRLGQNPSTLFASSTIYSIEGLQQQSAAAVKILSFGVFGPNGGLPLHLTEYVRERLHNHGDSSPADFVDLFHHRLISLFYRAWADAQPIVQLDSPGRDKFSLYAGALVGMGFDGSWGRDSVQDSAKLYASSHLVRLTRNAEGLEQLVTHYFSTPARLTEFVSSWIVIDPSEQTRLSSAGAHNQLGVNAIAGARIEDVQSRFRLTLGAMPLSLYERFLPTECNNLRLRDWVRNYLGVEMDWEVELQLMADEVPRSALGGGTRLGWTTWLGKRPQNTPAADLRLNPERDAYRMASRQAQP